MTAYIVIPSYEPSETLIELIHQLKRASLNKIIVIDDGSGDLYASIFKKIENQGVILLRHTHNLGKGAALKTGIKHVLTHEKDVPFIITCDSDGQHLVKDIQHLYETALNHDAFILGVRHFKARHVPFKSRFGNAFSSLYFKLKTGIQCQDTQTGLRVIPSALYPLALDIEENRFDYEMQFLLRAVQTDVSFLQIPIETVYKNNNDHSHFRPFKDAMLIYKQPFKYAFSSLTSALLDISLFTVFLYMLSAFAYAEQVILATIIARLISGTYNFFMNRLFSFKKRHQLKKQMGKYVLLYVTQLLLSMGLVYAVSLWLAIPSVIKIFVDGTLFIVSYFIQKHWVFK